ncbi:MAG TPA: hypothetical protein PK671_15785, partial [Candidatus Obscuribacter sp.]|nr:hypothetical protein [Candidatus Obscuribacter sp.]
LKESFTQLDQGVRGSYKKAEVPSRDTVLALKLLSKNLDAWAEKAASKLSGKEKAGSVADRVDEGRRLMFEELREHLDAEERLREKLSDPKKEGKKK